MLVILAYMDGWTYVGTDVRTYERTVDDFMAIKPKFLASMGQTRLTVSNRGYSPDCGVFAT